MSEGSENRPSIELEDDAVIGRAFWRSVLVFVATGGAAGLLFFLTNSPAPPPPPTPAAVTLPQQRDTGGTQIPKLPFRDVTEAAGIGFVHDSGAAGLKLLPETMGSGVAALDVDNDGDQDLVFVNSAPWPWNPPAAGSTAAATQRLYRNDGRGHFEDVTAGSGLDVTFYGMGVAAGDFDNDGWVDLLFTAVGKNRLFRNVQGAFVEVTDSAGVGGTDEQWTTGCAWVDYNRDGRLDLFVAHYVKWSREIDLVQDFRLVGVGRAYGPPAAFEGTFSALYRNDGGGKFTDVSEAAGMQVRNPNTGVPMGKSLGVAPVDLDRDGWIDLVVANDTVQNFVFHNQQDGTFAEIGAVSGVAFDPAGNARGAMGIDAGYFRNDDALGIAIGNFANEMTSLYVASGGALQFTDEALATGLGPATRLELKFGVCFVDIDLDGRLDLFAANGHLEEEINKVLASQHYAQSPHLFWNCGPDAPTEFLPVPADNVGTEFARPAVGRGVAYADFDGDGDLDLVLTANRGAPRLLRNDQRLGHHWVRFKLIDEQGTRDAIGAWVEVRLGDVWLRRQVMPTRGYLSQSELPVTIGLGMNTTVDEARVVWPDGTVQPLADVPIDRELRVVRPAR